MVLRAILGKLRTAVALLVLVALSASCGYESLPTSPDDNAAFYVTVRNVGNSVTFFIPDSRGSTNHSLAPGEEDDWNFLVRGKNGDEIQFSVYDGDFPASPLPGTKLPNLLSTATCKLSNADDPLIFPREVQFNIPANLFHCIGWGN